MCGRYTNNAKWREITDLFPATVPAEDPEPAYNLAPTQMGWTLGKDGEGGAKAGQMKWGLLPAWAKDAKMAYSTINARVETVATKPAFRGAWKAGRRCLVISTGYYEWPVIAGEKRPHFIHRTDSHITMFGGIWEKWGDLLTYSIVTKDADENIAPLHDRMPLILPPDLWGDWLNGSVDDAMGIASTIGEQPMAYHEVGKAVGNVRNQGPQLIEPIAA